MGVTGPVSLPPAVLVRSAGRHRAHDPPVTANGCLLCRVEEAEVFFGRQRMWQDACWRVSVVLHGAVVGFAHLEPHRHISFITDLDGVEAATLGPMLARVTVALRAATAADKVYVHVCGDRVPLLHVNLAPYVPDGPLVGGRGLLREGAPEVDPAVHQGRRGGGGRPRRAPVEVQAASSQPVPATGTGTGSSYFQL